MEASASQAASFTALIWPLIFFAVALIIFLILRVIALAEQIKKQRRHPKNGRRKVKLVFYVLLAVFVGVGTEIFVASVLVR